MTLKNINNPPLNDVWWNFSMTTRLLVGGLVLLNVGCFLSPSILDTLLSGIFNILDFRVWAWWYFVVLFLVIAFSVKWFLLYQSWEDLDPTDIEIGRRFLRMSIVITIESLILIILKVTWLIRPLYYSLEKWFGFGAFSYMGAFAFLLICIAVAMTVYVVKEWFIAVSQSY